MLFTPTRRAAMLPLALGLMLSSTSCGGDKRPALSAGSRPSIDRVTPAPRRAMPVPTAACPNDASRLCYTDAQTGQVLADQDATIDDRGRQLCWLRVWFGYPPCPPDN